MNSFNEFLTWTILRLYITFNTFYFFIFFLAELRACYFYSSETEYGSAINISKILDQVVSTTCFCD